MSTAFRAFVEQTPDWIFVRAKLPASIKLICLPLDDLNNNMKDLLQIWKNLFWLPKKFYFIFYCYPAVKPAAFDWATNGKIFNKDAYGLTICVINSLS